MVKVLKKSYEKVINRNKLDIAEIDECKCCLLILAKCAENCKMFWNLVDKSNKMSEKYGSNGKFPASHPPKSEILTVVLENC